MWFWVGPMNAPPDSIVAPLASQVVVEHPAADPVAGLDDAAPTRPPRATLRAATSPAMPAPTTTTSTCRGSRPWRPRGAGGLGAPVGRRCRPSRAERGGPPSRRAAGERRDGSMAVSTGCSGAKREHVSVSVSYPTLPPWPTDQVATSRSRVRRTPRPAQARSRRRVEAILDAAERLVVERGVEALTTRDIAEAAGVPVASLYQYFADKEDVLLALAERDMDEMDEQVAADLAASRGARASPRWCAPRCGPSSRSTTAPGLRGDLPARPHQRRRRTGSGASTTRGSRRPCGTYALEAAWPAPTSPRRRRCWPSRSATGSSSSPSSMTTTATATLVEEGITMMTAYLERYAACSTGSRLGERPRQRGRGRAGLAAEGLLVGTAGNVAARRRPGRGDRAPGVVLAELRADDVVVVDLDGDGGRRRLAPTSRARPAPGRLRRHRGRRGRAHPRAVLDRGRLRARRAAGAALPAAAARRRGPGRAVRHLRHARAGRARARRPRRAAGGADGQPRLGRDRRARSRQAVEHAVLLEWLAALHHRASALGTPRVLTDEQQDDVDPPGRCRAATAPPPPGGDP